MTEKDTFKKILDNLIEHNKKEDSFLLKRNLIDPDKEDFGINHNSKTLLDCHHKGDTKIHSFVTFSAYPTESKKYEINDKKFHDWIKDNSTVNINEHVVQIIPDSKIHYDLDSITFNNDYNGIIRRYTEFVENGYLEQSFVFPLIWDSHKNDLIVLDLCRTTGLFWAFLIFIKNYYKYQKYLKNLEIRLIVHKSKELTLSGFGGTVDNNHFWTEPTGDSYYGEKLPSTHRDNIEIKKDVLIKDLTDIQIPIIAQNFSNKLSNGYDLEFAKCYNHDGTFNFKKFVGYNN